ncbi:uncharacterized protein MYCGRDRAFT_106125 [Zymoseptoria tritici IPO323]|uniref:Uncharacterized protein n=1 Tax=Zymoseptoria tritici (strain CBS 115943 / IPO323) TaxID=336722 RepID=F9XN28_ZYMTI|nr:uncharacterized protein MYCGRDRAFT_106125 [Zymoseptoria tritici IPO323]EGP83341.1 hypothetical protein MYCGRDRAFT_106125 [Zymoseptoria tritici IPO323]
MHAFKVFAMLFFSSALAAPAPAPAPWFPGCTSTGASCTADNQCCGGPGVCYNDYDIELQTNFKCHDDAPA